MSDISPPQRRTGLQVIGIGLMRTGTTSLHAALERLLGGKCYQMQTVIANPHHADFWLKACKQMPTDDEWREFFKDYAAAIEFPTVAFYERLIKVFPDAKVILTERDPIHWSYSVNRTTAKYIDLMRSFPLDVALSFTSRHNLVLMIRRVYAKRFKHDITKKFTDQVHMVATFVHYLREVRRMVAPERMLAFQAFEGWEPVCNFLGVPEPDEPYPHLETTEESEKKIEAIERPLRVVQALLTLALAVVIGFLSFTYLPLEDIFHAMRNMPLEEHGRLTKI